MKCFLFFLFYFSFILFACNSPQTNPSSFKSDSTIPVVDDPNKDGLENYDSLTCEDLQNKKNLWHFASEHSFSTHSNTIDTSQIVILRGHFIDNKSEQTLVWIADYPMPSCGDGCNLVMLFSCDKKVRMLFTTTTGVFTKDDVRDLDNDGVLEIISESSIARMGESHEHYEIFNLKDTAMNVLYEHDSYFVDYFDFFKNGDTIGISVTTKLTNTNSDHVFGISQSRKISVYNGGKTTEEMIKKQITTDDSSFISLKKIK